MINQWRRHTLGLQPAPLLGPDRARRRQRAPVLTTVIASTDEAKKLFAGKPQDKVDAAVDALREGLRPYAGPNGVVMNGTAWLALAHR